MPRLCATFTPLVLVAAALSPSVAVAEWQEESFDIIAEGASGTALEPSLAAGVDHPTEEECAIEPCALEEPVPVTKVAFVDTANGGDLTLASRFGDAGEPWGVETIREGPTRHPQLILDNDGGEIITFLDPTSFSPLRIARRTLPEMGNCGPDKSFYCRVVASGNIDMPAPVVMQYHAAYSGAPEGGERRLHVVFSRDGELWHAFIEEERFWAGDPFEEYPIGGIIDVQSGEITIEPDAVAGEWPAATPVYATDYDTEPCNYEAFPGVAYDEQGVSFRRGREKDWSSTPMMAWTERVELGNEYDQRPTIDTRYSVPAVAWAPACSSGAAGLYYREAREAEPWDIFGWQSSTAYVAENACDPSLSVGKYGVPYVAYVEPGEGSLELKVRLDEDKPWSGSDVIDEGAEPSMDYNPATGRQSIAYTEPGSGELRVVDGFWF